MRKETLSEERMKQILEKLVASLSVLIVFCMHVYFVMLLGTKPALAAETEKASTVKVEMIDANGKTKTNDIKIQAADQTDDSADGAATTAVTEDDTKGLNIRINKDEGITITGSEKLVEKLKDLEKSIEEKVNERETVIAAGDSFGKTLENVLVPIMIFLISFGFAGYVVYAKQRTRKEYLETIRTLAQNNQPIPPELLASLNTSSDMGFNRNKWNNDPNSIQGVKYLFIGLGIAGFMILIDDYSVAAALGYMFAVIGGYHIVKSNLLQKKMEASKTQAVVPEVTVTPAPSAPTTPSNP